MTDLEQLFAILAAGGDVGIYVVAYILWKFDRRLLKLETRVITGGKDDGNAD